MLSTDPTPAPATLASARL
ncbi:MAG: hypothetical protein LBH28_08600 [Oscillospiraceae bacterium]|nr:hypothetical protein [Oscillospiraceae bacterium]